jgi:hypothetical protein
MIKNKENKLYKKRLKLIVKKENILKEIKLNYFILKLILTI